MASDVKNLIEFTGLSDNLPINPTAFKQLTVQETLEIPEIKAAIEKIVKIKAQIVIISTRIFNTQVGTSLEGQILTGKKLIVQGEIRQKIEYAADEYTQSVHAAHFNTPFSTFIILPKTYGPGTPIMVTPYIEDIFVELIDKRTIFTNFLLLLDA